MGRTQLNCYSISSVPLGTDSGTYICRGLCNFQYLAPKHLPED